MATEAEIGEGAAASGGGKKKKLLIIGGAAVAVLLAGGAGLYVFLSSAQAPGASAGPAVIEAPPQGFIFTLAPMTVNLNAEGGQAGFLRVTVALEVASEQVMHDIQPNIARVTDTFQVYLRELRRSDLEGSAGIYRLKEELLRRVNLAIYPARVEAILFHELLVQ